MIQSADAFRDLCGHLAGAGAFAFDTEFIGETTYEPILCLVQVATRERVELIDPFAPIDLEPFWKLMADPKVEKVVHAGDQDLMIAFQHSGLPPRNVYDTQIGAGMIGLGYPLAYWRLVEMYAGVSLDKAHTYSAWDRRPLSREQVAYAIDDVKYLLQAKDRIDQQVTALGRRDWMTAACDELCAKAAKPADVRTVYLKVKGSNSLNPAQLAVLRELAAWREQAAFEHDLPARAFLKDEVLTEWANRPPRKEADLLRAAAFRKDEVATYGADILAAVERGRAVAEADRPVANPAKDDSTEVKRLTEQLWAAAQVICLGQSVTPGLAVSQAEVAALARVLAEGGAADTHPLLEGWHAACVGRPLVEFAKGRTRLGLQMTGDRMRLDLSPPSPPSSTGGG